MKPNKLDDIFQVKGGIPFLAGFYIGMGEEQVKERIEELCEGQNEQSSDSILYKLSKYNIVNEPYDLGYSQINEYNKFLSLFIFMSSINISKFENTVTSISLYVSLIIF